MFRTAIRFIRYDKPKSIGALAGVVISIFLIGQQAGIFIFLTNAMASLVDNNSQYIWVVDEKTTNVNALISLDMRIGRQLASIPGVRRVNPIVIAGAAARFSNGKTAGLLLIGSVAPTFRGGPWNLYQTSADVLIPEEAFITDLFDRKTLGDALPGDYFEINGRKAYIAGNTRGVRGFGGGAYAFTTIERARAYGNFDPNKASAFLVEREPGVTEEDVIASINATINGARAWKSQELSASTVSTVLRSSGIALSVGSLIVFALISGFVIIGLTLYSSAIDRIRDYGTMKAIGANNGHIRRLILLQASMFSAVGFVVGYALVEGFRLGVANAGTIFELNWMVKAGLFLITLIIALGGSLFAIIRISRLEPAAVFRS